MNTQPKKEGSGAFIGSIIILIILVALGGYYFRSEIIAQKEKAAENQKIDQANAQEAAELRAIENELNKPQPDYSAEFSGTSTSR